MDGYGNASETNRRTDAWRMEHDSRGGLGTHLADKRGRSGRKDRALRQEIRISAEALSKRKLRHLRQMAARIADVNSMWPFLRSDDLGRGRFGKLGHSLTPPGVGASFRRQLMRRIARMFPTDVRLRHASTEQLRSSRKENAA